MDSHGLREDAALAVDATAVATVAWRAAGVTRVTVIAKASFAFASDASMPRIEPQPVLRAEVHHDNSPLRSVRLTTDLAPYLHQADVLFTGNAYAGATPLETIMVRLGVFDGPQAIVDKTLIVRQEGGFLKKPVVYEHAYGGIGWPDNPYGVGALGGAPTIIDLSDDKRRAGFGPIGQSWQPRKRLLGGTPRQALDARIAEIPDGFDWSYFQAAPPDQRAPFLRGDEWIVMDGLHPTLPRARMQLPGARGLACVYGLSAFGVAEGQPLVLHADTLRIDGDELRCTLTFRGVFPVVADEALAAATIVAGVELPGARIVWPEAEEIAARLAGHAGAAPQRGPAAPGSADTPVLKEATITLEDGAFESVRGDAFAGTLAFAPEASEAAAHQAVVLPFVAGASPLAQPGVELGPRRAPPVATSLGETLECAPEPAEPLARVVAAPPPPPAATPVPPSAEKKVQAASPWAPAPAPKAPAPKAPARPPAGPPKASPALKKGLYGRFGGDR